MQLNFEQLNFMKNLFPEYTGIPIPVPTKLQEIFLANFSVTEIHRESHSHINMHTITATNDLVLYMGYFLRLHC